jgi:hypothetical protein
MNLDGWRGGLCADVKIKSLIQGSSHYYTAAWQATVLQQVFSFCVIPLFM